MDRKDYPKRPNALKATKIEVDTAMAIDTFVLVAAMADNPVLGTVMVGMYPDPRSLNN